MMDLVVLVADQDQELAVKALLARGAVLGFRPLNFKMLRHLHHDNGCRKRPEEPLRSFHKIAQKALVLLDYEGSGAKDGPEALEREIEGLLVRNGWEEGRCGAVAIAPELEQWVWSNSPIVAQELGFQDASALKEWARGKGWLKAHTIKPERPKEAMLAALKEKRRSRSASIFASIAENIDPSLCQDRAWLRLRQLLSAWFPA